MHDYWGNAIEEYDHIRIIGTSEMVSVTPVILGGNYVQSYLPSTNQDMKP